MLFQNATVFYQGKFQTLDLKIQDDLILEVGHNLYDEEVIDCTGKLILPGAIDLHTHGCIGHDFSESTPEEIAAMQQYYASHGVTSVAATTMTMNLELYRAALKNIKAAMLQHYPGARILGINMEGPFLGKSKKGAHDEQYLMPLDEELFEELDGLSDNQIQIVDLDPCLDGAMEFISKYSKTKTISLAHTPCGYDTAMEAFDHGASHITHLFNAMNGLHHRDPGVIGALADRDGVRAEIICDGIHIHPAVIRMMFGLCPQKIVLISDSMSACGLGDGSYLLGGLPVTVKDGKATLEDGTIAGSTTNAFQCMVNAIRFGVPKEAAVLSATLLPAKQLKKDRLVGSIEPGKKADLVITDSEFSIQTVYCNGMKITADKKC